jgi:hypothetical protein
VKAIAHAMAVLPAGCGEYFDWRYALVGREGPEYFAQPCLIKEPRTKLRSGGSIAEMVMAPSPSDTTRSQR